MNAKQAREKAAYEAYINSIVGLGDVINKIEKEANNGNTYCYWYRKLSKDILGGLQGLGYKVEELESDYTTKIQTDGTTIIKW